MQGEDRRVGCSGERLRPGKLREGAQIRRKTT